MSEKPEIRTEQYLLRPSDSQKWIVVESPVGTAVDIQLQTTDYHYDCNPGLINMNGQQIPCSRLCCYQGCYINPKEIEFVMEILPDLKLLLTENAIQVLNQYQDQIYIPEDYDPKENLYKTRCAPKEWTQEELNEDHSEDKEVPIPSNHCIFLMENGLCALHKYCVEHGYNWVQKKFNICVTFPLDLRPKDKTLAFMDGFDHFTFGNVLCISSDEDKKQEVGMPQVVDSMKYAIVDRYGEEWWQAFKAFTEDFRAGKIDLHYIYSNTNNVKEVEKNV
jgi:hypothetical protein